MAALLSSLDRAQSAEAYLPVPMPPGIHVEATELDGSVFADRTGHTLYMWPFKGMRSGVAGENKGQIACTDVATTQTAGLMSPYPPGMLLPDLAQRVSCDKRWVPALAPDDAVPIGKWSIVVRKGGKKQWAYDEQALYTSDLDRGAGDTNGGSTRKNHEDSPAIRVPVGPPPMVPPGFLVKTTMAGRLLTTDKNVTVFVSDRDPVDASACSGDCTRTWTPLLAAQSAHPLGEWNSIERSPGVRQWTFRHRALYSYALDQSAWRLQGSDTPGWHAVYTQAMPAHPAEFTIQDSIVGQVLADSHGRTIYIYNCGDDSFDQLSCDHPADTQVYRLAICGGGDWHVCLARWPYVPAPLTAKAPSHSWSVIAIDPQTGHRATPGASDAKHVWAFRDRPVYTYGHDDAPGDVNGDGIGEWRGEHNGFKAFWLRDDFFEFSE